MEHEEHERLALIIGEAVVSGNINWSAEELGDRALKAIAKAGYAVRTPQSVYQFG